MGLKKYTKEECKEMIRTGCYPTNAPGWVVRAIRRRRQDKEYEIKSPEKEMEDFMKDVGGSPPATKIG